MEDDYREMNEEPRSPISHKMTVGEPVAPFFVEESAKVIKLLSDMSDMTRQILGQHLFLTLLLRGEIRQKYRACKN